MDKKYLDLSKNMLNGLDNNENIKEIEHFANVFSKDYSKVSELFHDARNLRNETIGNKVFIRASVEFGNVCSNKCKYCGMSVDNKNLNRYVMSEDHLKSVVYKIREFNIKQLHLVAGEGNIYDIDMIGKVIEYAKSLGINSTVVLGCKKHDDYKKLLSYGASRYIMKFETSNQIEYRNVKIMDTLDQRVANILLLKDLGFKVGTGIIVGLPNTDIHDLCMDLILLKKLQPDMSSCSVFSPNLESIYKNKAPGDIYLTLKFIALMRLLLKEKKVMIPCSSSLGFEGQILALNAGANLISVHFTPEEFSNNFSMYKSKNRIKRSIESVHAIVNKVGMVVSEYE
ncbi:biotin synthase BioB [Clostridium estertheticum]|uniref:biotin synthase BioB n=1 Tax=Clostridium estertheticum TaxID=238834 RepID=UPI00124C45A3|nr:radical SAM protein [Clostridium estertheticum]MBZ9618256.1 radical SAM protein [Clostridium estertheticum subsp. laramiense]WAG76242.1 radical SAM protein [Clostridium estertheticum]